MTPEQWGHITSRLDALEFVVIELARALRIGPELLARAEVEREVLRAAQENSTLTDKQIAEIQARIDRLLHEIAH